MNKPVLFYDIETAPLPLEQLEKIMPVFEPAKNLKDPDKIAANIAEKRQAFIDDAGLRATTGKIICFSWAFGDDEPMVSLAYEQGIIHGAAELFSEIVGQNGSACSFNGHHFDIPFLCQRGAVVGLPQIRKYLLDSFRGKVYPHPTQIDVLTEFLAGRRDFSGYSLDAVAKCLGLEGKPEGVTGKDFAKLLEADREKAVDYAKHDITILREIVRKMGL